MFILFFPGYRNIHAHGKKKKNWIEEENKPYPVKTTFPLLFSVHIHKFGIFLEYPIVWNIFHMKCRM